jgi:hypothetical protein
MGASMLVSSLDLVRVYRHERLGNRPGQFHQAHHHHQTHHVGTLLENLRETRKDPTIVARPFVSTSGVQSGQQEHKYRYKDDSLDDKERANALYADTAKLGDEPSRQHWGSDGHRRRQRAA